LPIFLVVRIGRGSRTVDDLAKINTGFSVGGPVILISDNVYEKLGRPKTIRRIRLSLAGYVKAEYDYLGKCEVQVLTDDKMGSTAEAYMLYRMGKPYSLISDELTDRLGVQILAPGEGLWRFRDDPPDRVRTTVFKPKGRFEDLLKE